MLYVLCSMEYDLQAGITAPDESMVLGDVLLPAFSSPFPAILSPSVMLPLCWQMPEKIECCSSTSSGMSTSAASDSSAKHCLAVWASRVDDLGITSPDMSTCSLEVPATFIKKQCDLLAMDALARRGTRADADVTRPALPSAVRILVADDAPSYPMPSSQRPSRAKRLSGF